jgi:hypothetical protein
MSHESFRPMVVATMNHYLRFVAPADQGGVMVKIEGAAPIAHSAFLMLLLAEWDQAAQREPLIRRLAQGLLQQQNPDGAYRTSFGEAETKRGIDYYPGEAMLALMSAYDLFGESAYLASAERAFPYYRRYWRGHRSTAFVSWHAQVNRLLYRATRQERYAAFTFEMADWLIDTHQIRRTSRLDEVGGFGVGAARRPSNSTASFLEGINAAYALAVSAGDGARVSKYAEAIRLGTRFVLQTQVTPEYAMLLRHPKRALGGFTQSVTKNIQRNDYTQHAVMALMAALENHLMRADDTAGSER